MPSILDLGGFLLTTIELATLHTDPSFRFYTHLQNSQRLYAIVLRR
jgi:hypothetical protein